MSITERFDAAVAAAAVELPGAHLLPERLARASAHVLPVDGAGISLFFSSGRRLPLGASDDVSAEAERLQFTVGEGPCLQAHDEGRPVLADDAGMQARWPTFYDDLVARTPIRGVISLPLQGRLQGSGALDLYVVPPHDVHAVGLFDAVTVVGEVTAHFLRTAGRQSPDADGPAWLDAPAAGRRSLVWQAMGVVNAALGVTSPDALAVLRARAYSEGRDLDGFAAALLSREVPVERLLLEPDASG